MSKNHINHSAERITELLAMHVPASAVAYCLKLWLQYPFSFKLSKKRKTKHGDYRYHPAQQAHVITVNSTLNRYAFLITYIHEIAHLDAFLKHGHHIAPHGTAWKHSFQHLMQPVLQQEVFPEAVFSALSKHMQHPKASSSTDPQLVMALQQYDLPTGSVALATVPLKQKFSFHQRVFTKDEVKRTRAWCTEIKSGKRYTIPVAALVEIG